MDWLERVAGLRQWSRDGVRAPHKPLLMLYALGRYRRAPEEPLRYTDVEEDLRRLLEEFGTGNAPTPNYPFHHLVNDGVWEVRTAAGPGSPGSRVGALRESGATGQLSPGLRAALAEDPELLGRMARLLLDANFPESLHPEICSAVGLGPESVGTEAGRLLHHPEVQRRRDPLVRERILVAYEYRCAFCGYDGMLGGAPVGLEAAHVRWWAFGGPDEVGNGLCLCALHHKLFDKGVLGLDTSHRILVSQRFIGRSVSARRGVLDLAGQKVIGPQPGSDPVAAEHIDWHTRQVFRGAARTAA